jgi:hypothetical protein
VQSCKSPLRAEIISQKERADRSSVLARFVLAVLFTYIHRPIRAFDLPGRNGK